MSEFENVKKALVENPKTWLVTGVSGFIGSNLLETLLKLNQNVVGLDNFATSSQKNLDLVRDLVDEAQWKRFSFTKGDIRDFDTCLKVSKNVDAILHQAALGSVPRSIKEPLVSNDVNVTGTLNVFMAAHENKVKRVVYAASSSTYGDHPGLPKQEDHIGEPLSPYAVTKYVNELYASVMARCFSLETIGLRYFNVFGQRQDPDGAYAAVIPKWIASMIRGEQVAIYGTGETSRDFCYIENVVQANLLSATTENPKAINQVYNVAVNQRTDLNELYELLRSSLEPYYTHLKEAKPKHQDFRSGDVLHSQADVSKARDLLGYDPKFTMQEGLKQALEWYKDNV